MRIVVSDAVCLIDLRKVALLGALLHLPYTFVIPDTVFEDELLSLTEACCGSRMSWRLARFRLLIRCTPP